MTNKLKEIRQELKTFYASCLSIPFAEFENLAQELDLSMFKEYTELRIKLNNMDHSHIDIEAPCEAYRHITKRLIVKVCISLTL